MGVVIRPATSLDRIVAIKFLPRIWIDSKTAQTRFLQEARRFRLESSQHPIVYDGDYEGQSFMALEYLPAARCSQS